jgi:hypothetical protein
MTTREMVALIIEKFDGELIDGPFYYKKPIKAFTFPEDTYNYKEYKPITVDTTQLELL